MSRAMYQAMSLFIVLCLWDATVEAAVTFIASDRDNVTATTIVNPSITVSGTNPVLVVGISMDSATATVTSVTWSLGGSFTEIGNIRSASTAYTSIWCLAAPTSGAGQVTGNFSASVTVHMSNLVYSGADQANPCVAFTSSTSVGTSTTLTPSGLTTGDATYGAGSLTISGDPVSVTPNQRTLSGSGSVNTETGDATNTTGVTFNWANGPTSLSMGAIRLVQAGGGTAASPTLTLLGVGPGQ